MRALILFVFMFLTVLANGQNYKGEVIYENASWKSFDNLFVLGDKIWANYNSTGFAYYDGSNWSSKTLDFTVSGYSISGLKNGNNNPFIVISESGYLNLWDNVNLTYRQIESPAENVPRLFVYSEDKTYICTRKTENDDGEYKANLYLWNGQEEDAFSVLAQWEENLRAIYVKSPDRILLLSSSEDQNKILIYNGEDIQEVALVNFSDEDFFTNMATFDGENFYIQTLAGSIYHFNDQTFELNLIFDYLDDSDSWRYMTGIIIIDNDNLLLYGAGGIRHLKASTVEVQDVSFGLNTFITSGFYNRENGRMLFTGQDGHLIEVKQDTGTYVNHVAQDISSQMRLYPNPATDRITVDLQLSGQKSGAIYNIAGAQVMNFEFSYGQSDVNIAHLPKGIYLMKINTSEGMAVRKFVKK